MTDKQLNQAKMLDSTRKKELRCSCLAIQNENGELTEWGRTLSEHSSDESSLFGSQTPIEKATKFREDEEIPEHCPHEVYDEDIGKCIFHLSSDERDQLGVTSTDVRNHFLSKVRGDSSDNGQNHKSFVNAKLPEIQLNYVDLDSYDNYPIDLRFSQIENLELRNSTIHLPLRFEWSSIEGCSCENTSFRANVDFSNTTICSKEINFRNTDFRQETDFVGTTFRTASSSFKKAQFHRGANFHEANFLINDSSSFYEVSFEESRFHDRVSFRDLSVRLADPENSRTRVRVDFRRCSVTGETISFKSATFGTVKKDKFSFGPYKVQYNDELEKVNFKESDFSNAHVDFSSAKFTGDLVLENLDFRGSKVDFNQLFVGKELSTTGSTFSDRYINWGGLCIRGDADFSETTFYQTTGVRFEDASFFNDLNFSRTEITGGNVNFTDIKVKNGLVNLSHSTFDVEKFDFTVEKVKNVSFSGSRIDCRSLEFDNVKVTGDVRFEKANFSGGNIDFSGSTIEGGIIFDDSTISGETIDLSLKKIKEQLSFEHCRFDCKRFDMLDVEASDLSFKNVRLNGKEWKFDHSRFNDVWFSESKMWGNLSFKKTSFNGDTVDFSDINAQEANFQFNRTKIKKSDSRDDSTIINFSRSIVPSGQFIQPKKSRTYYDFTKATVGNLQLEFASSGHHSNERLFEYYRFLETDFDGFDFSRAVYREELKNNGWRLHTLANGSGSDNKEAGWGGRFTWFRNLTDRYRRLIREGSNPNPRVDTDEMESTYRKAKIGADENGDSEASSKFFQKELRYRRKGHGWLLWLHESTAKTEVPTSSERIRRAWLWAKNYVLWISSGYGERPTYVIFSSLFVIVLFSLIYEAAWTLVGSPRPDSLTGLRGSLMLSAEMFTSIILGGAEIENQYLRAISYFEGFVGSFFIALFVVTITRAIRR